MKSLAFLLFTAAAGCLVAQVPVARTVIADAAQPQLAIGSNREVWLVYGRVDAPPAAPAAAASHGEAHGGHNAKGHAAPTREGDVFVAVSADQGATFGAPTKVAHVPGLALGMRRGPRIAASGSRLTVTVVGKELLAFSSADGGLRWTGPVTVNDVPTSAREGLHDLAVGPGGELFATWLDLREGKMELWGASSADGGRHWGKNAPVYRSPGKSICECCHPTALFDAEGNLAVMWRNLIDGSRDMWMTTRAKGATEFMPARKVGEGSWKLNACPMDGGRLVALGGGKFAAVFQRAGEVFFAPPDGPEIALGKGKQPLGVLDGPSSLVLWQDGNDLVGVRRIGERPVKYTADARFAVVAELPDRGGLVVAYEQGPAKEKQPGIVVERL